MKKIQTFISRKAMQFSVMFPVANAATAPTDILNSKEKVIALICSAMTWLFWGLIVFTVAMFLVGGYTYVSAAGDAEKVRKANRTLLYAAIGCVVAIFAKGIPLLIGSFLGVPADQLSAC